MRSKKEYVTNSWHHLHRAQVISCKQISFKHIHRFWGRGNAMTREVLEALGKREQTQLDDGKDNSNN